MLGIFDSGVGGLSVLKKIKEKNPKINIVYFGDIKNAPYGIKSQEELKKLTYDGIEILLQYGATNILSACNSISVFMLFNRQGDFGISEMISPIVASYSKCLKKKITILATPATIESKIYQKEFLKKGLDIEAISVKKLAGAIEFGASDYEIKVIVEKVIARAIKHNPDKIILCCTHYPLVMNIFKKSLEENNSYAELIDPAKIVAEKTLNKFKEKNGDGKLLFLVSQESQIFKRTVEKYFREFDYRIKVLK